MRASGLTFFGQVDLGVGGTERVAVLPLLAWTVAVAVPLSRRDQHLS